MERFIESTMDAVRGLRVPICMCRPLPLKLFQEIFHVVPRVFELAEAEPILMLLSMIDMVLAGGLQVMISGYE